MKQLRMHSGQEATTAAHEADAAISKPDCQSCRKHEALSRLANLLTPEDPPFLVCANCLIRLVNLALKSEQFQNLIASGHTAAEYYLCSDFYTKSGKARQPRI